MADLIQIKRPVKKRKLFQKNTLMMKLPAGFKEQKKPQLFENLSEESLQAVLQHSVIHEYASGKLLVQQGDSPAYIFLIIDGSLRTYRMSEDGGEATIRMLEPGDTCMEAVLFMGGTSPINVQTIGLSKILMIPERIVKEQVLKDPQFSLNLLRIVTRHYKNAIHQIEAMNIQSPIQRVGYYFLQKHLEQGHDNLEFKLPFKKQAVANYLGMTPETFSRTLKQMKDMGIKAEEDTIRMRDSFALCHFCDSDTASMCSRHDRKECTECPLH